MKRKTYKLTHARLLERLEYDSALGRLRWRNKRNTIAGTKHGDHRRIYIDGEFIYEHLLIWFYVHGSWPKNIVDHIDVEGSNNEAGNLRDITVSENALNRAGANSNNRLGVRGVHAHGRGYRAQLMVGGVKLFSHVRDTVEDARAEWKLLVERHCPRVITHVDR
ncbi:HNH endonuclease [Caballeronia sp. DA-9]|uniref:HNH endonuclease n=1 Tax=Caballeronia sp. DA-9 TaxID=3436237 RepID=UPI003F670324